MEKRAKALIGIFFSIVILIFALFFLIDSSEAQSASTKSNVTVTVSLGLSLSTNLSYGIIFGTLSQGVQNATAFGNYDYNDTTEVSAINSTSLWIHMADDNNVGGDTCISANTNLEIDGGDEIGLTNYTYAANQSRHGFNMNKNSTIALTTTSTKFGDLNLAAGINQTTQYWLDVPSVQTAGNYNNSVTFTVIQTGGSC